MGEINIHVKSEFQRSWRVRVLLAMIGDQEEGAELYVGTHLV